MVGVWEEEKERKRKGEGGRGECMSGVHAIRKIRYIYIKVACR